MYDKLTKSYHANEYMPFDVRAVMLFMLGDFNEIQHGYAGIGEYNLLGVSFWSTWWLSFCNDAIG